MESSPPPPSLNVDDLDNVPVEEILSTLMRTNLQLIKEHISSAVQELKDEFVDLSPDTGDLESQLTDTVQKQCLGIREELGWKLIQLGQERLKKAKENHATQCQLRRAVAHLRRSLHSSDWRIP
ncbi:hypothetical protein TruAng_011782 [Truncatella angustata]|nr:hypothetical protein TruAng_011782 [Truncatella angustata]